MEAEFRAQNLKEAALYINHIKNSIKNEEIKAHLTVLITNIAEVVKYLTK